MALKWWVSKGASNLLRCSHSFPPSLLQSLPSIGRTSRDAFGSVSALTALPLTSLLPRTPSYSISRSEIIAHGLKRSHCGDSHTSLPSIRTSPPRVAFASAAAMSPSPSTSLTFHVPAPPSAKRLRRESLSPTSVGEVSTAKKPSAAKPAAAATPGATQMQSILRGLRHLSACSSSGCSNPLCVSTRAFVDKVKAHRSNTTGQATHDATRCGACKLWGAILRAHAPICACRATCRVPGCPPQP